MNSGTKKKVYTSFDKNDKLNPSIYFGIISVSFGILGDIISYILFPYTQYNFFQQAVSALCLGSGGLFFNIGNVFSGIFALIFVNLLAETFDDDQSTKRLKSSAIIFANISCICFIILGFFCGSNIIIAYIHGIAALTSWGFGFLYITFFNILILKDQKYSKNVAYAGFIVSIFLALLMIFFLLHLLPIFRSLMIILPLLEWLNTGAIIFWYFMIPIHMALQKI
ncbi:MAG: hypothetical protein ACFFG0_45740 [Candidatus Thorarchaeota archaeon]